MQGTHGLEAIKDGMMRSIRMGSGWTRWAARTPSSPLTAVSTRNPAFRRALRKRSVSVGESSTIRAAAIVPAGTLGCPGAVWDLGEETIHVDATIGLPMLVVIRLDVRSAGGHGIVSPPAARPG